MSTLQNLQIQAIEAKIAHNNKIANARMAASKAQSAVDVTAFAQSSTTHFNSVHTLAEAFNDAQKWPESAPLNSVKRAVVAYYKTQLKTKVLYTKLTQANYNAFLAYVNK